MPLVSTPYDDITRQIIGAAMDVHNELGPGYKELVYQEALTGKLSDTNLNFIDQYPFHVYTEEVMAATFYMDFVVEEVVIVEIKALTHLLTDDEVAQVINYLTATGLPLGLLINFGRRRLEFKRIFPPKKVQAHRTRLTRYRWEPER